MNLNWSFDEIERIMIDHDWSRHVTKNKYQSTQYVTYYSPMMGQCFDIVPRHTTSTNLHNSPWPWRWKGWGSRLRHQYHLPRWASSSSSRFEFFVHIIYSVGGIAHCAGRRRPGFFQSVEKHIAPWLRHMLAMYKTRKETQKGDAKELDIVNTKSSSTSLHNKMELKQESEKLCGV
jgi:hypothetical protein